MTHILVIGGGGREHALAWKLAQSPRVTRISVAPGNGGMADIPIASSVDIDATDIVSLIDYVDTEAVDLTVVGPEEPLAGGLVNQFEAAGLRIFGPQRRAAMIETSKSHAKELMIRYGVPTAPFVEFTELLPAMEYVVTHPVDELVIKADGLAQGKGVFLPRGESDAEGILRALLERDALGSAGHRVIIENRLLGPEVSVMAFCDGHTLASMPGVCDYKRLYDQDRGPNTGGMGAIAPTPALTPALSRRIEQEILLPVLHGLAADGSMFRGVLYAGVILAEDGPLALEMNVRFGDPGAQVVLPLLESDLLDVIDACLDGTLESLDLRWRDETAVAVVMVTQSYPARRNPNHVIWQSAPLPPHVQAFHAGTRISDDTALVTTGGRVLGLTAVAPDPRTAIALAYEAVQRVHFDGAHFRSDIGAEALAPHQRR